MAGMMSEDFKAGIRRAMEIVVADGKPGPGGIDITGGIPSQIYVGIGRERYDGENGEYELAQDTAEAVRNDILSALGHEIGEQVSRVPTGPTIVPNV